MVIDRDHHAPGAVGIGTIANSVRVRRLRSLEVLRMTPQRYPRRKSGGTPSNTLGNFFRKINGRGDRI
jgi:hypothetical protein